MFLFQASLYKPLLALFLEESASRAHTSFQRSGLHGILQMEQLEVQCGAYPVGFNNDIH